MALPRLGEQCGIVEDVEPVVDPLDLQQVEAAPDVRYLRRLVDVAVGGHVQPQLPGPGEYRLNLGRQIALLVVIEPNAEDPAQPGTARLQRLHGRRGALLPALRIR